MTKWLIAYKKNGTWYKFCYSNTRKGIATALDRLFEFDNTIEDIQIKKVVV